MSHFDYARSQELAHEDNSFASLIMAAMRRADSTNLEALKTGFPEISDDLQTRYNAPGGRLAGERLAERIHSRDPQHQEDDLRASLEFAHAEGLIDRPELAAIIAILHREGGQAALRALTQHNSLAFGLVCLFHLGAETSLRGDAEVVSRVAFDEMGLTVGDIGWPKSGLKWDHDDAAPEDPALEARLAAAIAAWKVACADD